MARLKLNGPEPKGNAASVVAVQVGKKLRHEIMQRAKDLGLSTSQYLRACIQIGMPELDKINTLRQLRNLRDRLEI